MTITTALSWASILLALAAAALWGLSAFVRVPLLLPVYGGVGNSAKFIAAFKKMSALNASAACCAFVSPLLQALSFIKA